MKFKTALTHQRLKEVLLYDRVTGIFRWRVSRGAAKAGSVAGSVSPDGYIWIRIDGHLYMAHRLAWLYETGSWPQTIIDHRNLNPSDNSFDNLRDATYSQNQANTVLRSINKTGFKGVEKMRGYNRWQARIRYKGKLENLGWFSTPEEAHEAYKVAAKRHYGDYACFG